MDGISLTVSALRENVRQSKAPGESVRFKYTCETPTAEASTKQARGSTPIGWLGITSTLNTREFALADVPFYGYVLRTALIYYILRIRSIHIVEPLGMPVNTGRRIIKQEAIFS